MQENLRARVAAGTAIFRGERILLLHRSAQAANPGIWDLPAGRVQARESLETAAMRETREETGFDVRLGRVFHVEVFGSMSKHGKMRPTVGVYFHCTAPPSRRAPRLDREEHSGYAWVARSDLESYPTVPFGSRTNRAAYRTRKAMSPTRHDVDVASWERSDSDEPLPA